VHQLLYSEAGLAQLTARMQSTARMQLTNQHAVTSQQRPKHRTAL